MLQIINTGFLLGLEYAGWEQQALESEEKDLALIRASYTTMKRLETNSRNTTRYESDRNTARIQAYEHRVIIFP